MSYRTFSIGTMVVLSIISIFGLFVKIEVIIEKISIK